MPLLTLYGLVAVTAMMLFYWLEDRWAGFTLAFGVACLASSAYGWLAGTWPFGVVEMVWAVIAFARWKRRTARAQGEEPGARSQEPGETRT
jgi:hypothetical protein